MRRFLALLRNAMPFLSAYSGVNTLTGDDLTTEAMFSQLRGFGDAPAESGPIPVALLMEFNAAQRRVKGRNKFRFGVGALFAVVVLVPGLAYAGVLPTSVAQVVQHIFDAVSVPIQIPSLASVPSAEQSGNADSPSPTPVATSADTQSSDGSSQSSPGAVDPSPSSNQDDSAATASSAPNTSGEGELGQGMAETSPMSENGGSGVASEEPSATVTSEDPSATPEPSLIPSGDLLATPPSESE